MKIFKSLLILSILLFIVSSSALFPQTEELEQIFEQNLPSVVVFSSFGENDEIVAKGAGFIIGEKILATSYSLVSQAKSAEGLDYKGKKVKFEGIMAVDKNFGVALVEINRKDPVLSLGSAGHLARGDKIYAIGANEADELSITEGEIFNFHEYESQRLIETSLTVPESYNGGPVFDSAGMLIGMIVFLDINQKIVIPAGVVSLIPKSQSATKFKDWQSEDYFSTLEGAEFASKIFLSMNSTSKAEKFLKKILELKPNDLQVLAELASVYSEQRNYSSAIETYKKIVELNPGRDDAFYGLGLVYIKMMNWKEAIPPLTKAVELNADNKEAYFYIADAYKELKEFAQAAEAYKKFIATNPAQPYEAYNLLGQCLMELEEYAGAADAFGEALKGIPADVNITYNLAQAYEKAGQLDKAAETFRRLAEIDPEQAKIYYNTIINMYNNAKLPEKAAEAARKLVELNPNDANALFNLGYMFVQMKKYDEAIEILKKVTELNPSMEYAYLNIAYSYYSMKQYSQAVEAYAKTAELFPENPDAWMFLGMSYMQQKNWSKAVTPLEKSIELRPDSGHAYYNLAICYLNLHDNYSARQVYEKLQQIDPNLAQQLQKYIK
jgi:tetratricopeptide (TPR) repeat protein